MDPEAPDPLQQRREAMTEWERGLRPRRERHLALWLVLAAGLVLMFYLGMDWLMQSQDGVVRHERSAAPSPSAPAVRQPTVPPGPPPAAATTPAPNSVQVIKCLTPSGRAAYSDGPCPEGSRTTIVELRRDENLADGLSVAEREASLRANAALAAQRNAYERQAARNADAAMAGCSALAERIRQLDALGRQPQGTYSLDRLRMERQQTRDEQFRRGCPQERP